MATPNSTNAVKDHIIQDSTFEKNAANPLPIKEYPRTNATGTMSSDHQDRIRPALTPPTTTKSKMLNA